MLKIRKSFMGTDENGNEVFMMKGDEISEISDAGPVLNTKSKKTGALYDPDRKIWYGLDGWLVTVRFTPSHKQWTELVTVDAVKLLKALEG